MQVLVCVCILLSRRAHAWACRHKFMSKTCCNTFLSLIFVQYDSRMLLFVNVKGGFHFWVGPDSKTLMDWYRLLKVETKALVREVVFEPLMCLLLESLASGVLGQVLVKRWWDTTYTFHIVEREMTMTPHDFHRMTELTASGLVVTLKGELGTTLSLEL